MTEPPRGERDVVERVGSALLVAGTVVGAIGLAAWVLDALPPMPPWLLRLAVYKLVLAAGAGLMLAGAVVRRQVREAERRRARRDDAHAASSGAGPALPGGTPHFPPKDAAREATGVRRER